MSITQITKKVQQCPQAQRAKVLITGICEEMEQVHTDQAIQQLAQELSAQEQVLSQALNGGTQSA